MMSDHGDYRHAAFVLGLASYMKMARFMRTGVVRSAERTSGAEGLEPFKADWHCLGERWGKEHLR